MHLNIKDKITKYRSYIVVILVSFFVMCIGMIISGSMPFGSKFPLAGNGFFQDYANFLNVVKQVKAGRFFSFLNYGTGLTFENTEVYYLRPWLYPVYYFVPESMYIYVFFFQYALFYILPGPIFIYYLTHRRGGKVVSSDSPILIVLGLCYALSVYSISFFIYVFRYMMVIPVIFLGIEKIVYDKSSKLYIIAMTYFMIMDVYYAFIMCIFSALYFLILNHKDVKDFVKNSIRFAVSSIWCAGLSAAFLIPYFIKTRNSPYGSGDSVMPSLFKWFGSFLYPLSEFRVANRGMVTSPYEYRANIYCGILVVLFAPCFLFLKDISLGERIKRTFFLLLIYIGFDNQFINFIFHGFHYQWQVPNRFSCFFVFGILVMFFDVLIRFKDISKKLVMVSSFVSGAVLTLSYFVASKNVEVNETGISTFYFSYVFLLIYVLVSVLYCSGIIKKYAHLLFCIVLLFEVIVSSIPTFMNTFGNSFDKSEISYVSDVTRMVKRHPDMSLPYVATERPGETYNQNIAYMTDSHSVSYYSSISLKQHFDLMFRWGMLFSQNITYYTAGSPLADMMLHVKYHVVDADSVIAKSPYVPIDYEKNMILYENPYFLPLGTLMDEQAISQWAQRSENYRNFSSSFKRDNKFAEAFGTGNIYDTFVINRYNDKMTDADSYFAAEEDSEGNAYYTFHFSEDIKGKVYLQIAQALEYVGNTSEEGADLYFYMPRSINMGIEDSMMIGILNEESLARLHDKLLSSSMVNQSFEGSRIRGVVEADTNKLLYLSMPALPGFTAFVDGKETQIIHTMDGIGVRVDAGKHLVELKYTPEGLVIGWQISFIFAILLLIYKLIKVKARFEEKAFRRKLLRGLAVIYMLLALFPVHLIFDSFNEKAFMNSWFVILLALIIDIYKMRHPAHTKTEVNRYLVALLTVLFICMLPIGDVIGKSSLIVGTLFHQIWKFMIYIPALVLGSYFVIHTILEKLIGESVDSEKRNSRSKLDNPWICFGLITFVSLMFLLSTYPGIWMRDDVARVLLASSEGRVSDWDTYGYLLFVDVFSIGGKYPFIVNIVQTVIWLIVNLYIILGLGKWSKTAMKLYTLVSILAVTPFIYLEVIFKDTVFSIGMLALTAGLFFIIHNKRIGKFDILVSGIASLFVTLCRQGGYIAVIIAFVVMIIYLVKEGYLHSGKKQVVKMVSMPAIHIMAYILVYVILFSYNNVPHVDAYVKYGTPISMIGAAAHEGVEFTDEETAELEKVMPVTEWADCYDKYWVDNIARLWGDIGYDNIVKLNDLVENEDYGSFIIKMNAKLLIKHPMVYLKAFMAMGNMIWEVSQPADIGAYNVPITPLCKIGQFEEVTYTPAYEVTQRFSEVYADVPLLESMFLRGGISLFFLVIISVVLFIKKNRRYILVFLPSVIYTLLLFFVIPAPDTRYILPILNVAIFVFAVIVGLKEKGLSE